jgi:molecular chaperone GrpE
MAKKIKNKGKETASEKKKNAGSDEKAEFKVTDRRFWVKRENQNEGEEFQEEHLYPSLVAELKAGKEESERKLLEYIQAFKKNQSEQEEFRERLKKDVENRVRLRKKELLLKLLDMLDNLDRAILSAEKEANNRRLLEGIILTREHFLSILKSEGIERMDTLGKTFDPNLAEAIMVEETKDPSKINIVLEEILPGYSFHEQMLRPAKVKVGVKSASSK